MSSRIHIFITLLILIIMPITEGTSSLNDTRIIAAGEQNLSNYSMNQSVIRLGNSSLTFDQNKTSIPLPITEVNITNSPTDVNINHTNSITLDFGENKTVPALPTPTRVFTQSIGSVYEPDFSETEAMTFSYSRCQ